MASTHCSQHSRYKKGCEACKENNRSYQRENYSRGIRASSHETRTSKVRYTKGEKGKPGVEEKLAHGFTREHWRRMTEIGRRWEEEGRI